METGSPTSSAFSIPWLGVLIACLASLLAAKLISHPDPALKAEMERRAAERSGASRSTESGSSSGRATLSSMSNEELSQFAKQTILERFEVEAVTLDEGIAALEAGVLKSAPNGKKPIIALSPEWQNPQTRVSTADQVRLQVLHLRNVPLEVAMKYMCDSTGTGFRYEAGKILITPSRWNAPNQKLCACGTPVGNDEDHPLYEGNQSLLEVDPSVEDVAPVDGEVLPPENE